MFAITLDQVKAIGAVISGAFFSFSVASAWLVKAMTKKIIIVVVFALLGLGAWTQRAAAQSCVSDARANALKGDTTCTFFGFDVTIPTAAGEGWYPDPTGRFENRYWDGQEWTEHVARGGEETTDPPNR